MRIIYLVFAIVFTLFAAVQYNDPDPEVWIPIYGFAALMNVLAFIGRKYLLIPLLGGILYVVGAVYIWPGSIADWLSAEEQAKSLQMNMPFIEEAREALGLLISAFSMFLICFTSLFSKKKKTSPKKGLKPKKAKVAKEV